MKPRLSTISRGCTQEAGTLHTLEFGKGSATPVTITVNGCNEAASHKFSKKNPRTLFGRGDLWIALGKKLV